MKKRTSASCLKFSVCAAALMLGCIQPSNGQNTRQPAGNLLIQEDKNYEQLLRINASPEEPITPARVLRWLNSLFYGKEPAAKPSNTEFQPVVGARDGRVRVVAQIAFRF